jgi:predicted unusual protein kinase regulating ubiquinone biosynthesis (AarF/ABC1/UbiB family)
MMLREKPVPASRSGRLMQIGRLATGVAGGMIGEGLKQAASGNLPSISDMLLTPANANRLAERLAEMRGAAMKIGQLLSMEANDLLPDELTNILSRLRQQAHIMPLGEVNDVLVRAWGEQWEDHFSRFVFTPVAAASIGQVHEANTSDGEHLAIKIQYPGVRTSIDSDIDNVTTLLRLVNMIPAQALQPILDEARQQLHIEADYLLEADHLDDFANLLAGDDSFVVPKVNRSLTTTDVLAMGYIEALPIESQLTETQQHRDRLAQRLLGLTLREFFQWGLVQTDPNFANFQYQPEQDRLVLFDFGATRRYPSKRRRAFAKLMLAGMNEDARNIERCAIEVGYLDEDDGAEYRNVMVQLISMATEPARQKGAFDFTGSDLAQRMSEYVLELRMGSQQWRMPPPDILFLHRKLGGMYMLCAKLKARVNVGQLVEQYADSEMIES